MVDLGKVLEHAAVVGAWAGGVLVVGTSTYWAARRLYREWRKDAVEPLAAELRPEPGAPDGPTIRQLMQNAVDMVRVVNDRVGDAVGALQRLDTRVATEQGSLAGALAEHKRMHDDARAQDRHRVEALERRVGTLERAVGIRGADAVLMAAAEASIRVAESLDPARPTPPAGVPKVHTDQ